MAHTQEQATNYVGSLFQVVWIAITSATLCLLLLWPYRTFTPLESTPELTTFTPKRLIEFGSPAQVRTGIYVKDFVSIDMTKGDATVELLVWFIFDPASISLNRVARFSFANGTVVEPPDLEKRLEQVRTRVYDNQHIVARFNIRADVRFPLRYNLFPIDDHFCPIILVNEATTSHQLQYEASRRDFVVDVSLRDFGWEEMDSDVRTGFHTYLLDKQDVQEVSYSPQVIFSVDYRRIGIRYIISIMLPLLLTFFVSLFAFSFDMDGEHAGQAFGFASGGITAMMAYYYVIQNMSPPVSYFMISDYLYYLFLLLNFLVFLIILFRVKLTVWQKRCIVALLHLIVLLCAGYLFIYWLR